MFPFFGYYEKTFGILQQVHTNFVCHDRRLGPKRLTIRGDQVLSRVPGMTIQVTTKPSKKFPMTIPCRPCRTAPH